MDTKRLDCYIELSGIEVFDGIYDYNDLEKLADVIFISAFKLGFNSCADNISIKTSCEEYIRLFI